MSDTPPSDHEYMFQLPARFRPRQVANREQPLKQHQVPSIAPPPRYPRQSPSARLSTDRSSVGSHAPPESTPTGSKTRFEASRRVPCCSPTTSKRASSLKSHLSIMDVVNQAAKIAELEDTAAAAASIAASMLGHGVAAGQDRPSTPRPLVIRDGSINSSSDGDSKPPSTAFAAVLHAPQQLSNKTKTPAARPEIPRSPLAQQLPSKMQHRQSVPVAFCAPMHLARIPQQARSSSSNSTLCARDASPRSATAVLPAVTSLDQHSKLAPLLPAIQPNHSSDCDSEELHHLTSDSSLCSSSSNSSLCSAVSSISNASTLSAASRPKSILLTRSSTSSSSSTASSPSFSKRVTWKDGQAHEEAAGQQLVAVKLLEDTPEMRRIRKDTWPEHPAARRDAKEAALAAAEAAAQKQLQQQQELQPPAEQQQQAGGSGLVGKLLELDWREKLRLLQQERRQQRMEQVAAGWQRQQAKQARLAEEQKQQCDQQQRQQDMISNTADCVKPSVCAAGTIHITAVAAVEAASS